MRPGSIVKCIRSIPSVKTPEGYTIPIFRGNEYTIRCVFPNTVNASDILVHLEEAINPTQIQSGIEYGYSIDAFRELLPPEAMQKEINELLEGPVPC